MIKQFQNLKLRTKLILIQVLTSGLLLFLFAAYFVVHEFQEYRINSVNQLKTSSQILASNSVSSLYFLDTQAAEKVLSSLTTQSNISNAWIHDSSGQLFASYSQVEKQDVLTQEDLISGEHFSGNFITYTRDVINEGDMLGKLTMRLDASGRWESLVSNSAIAGLLLLIGLILSYILSANTQKSISYPILKLAKTIQHVSDSGEYSIRVNEKLEDETGTLYRGFNGLMVQIAKREKELEEQHQLLQLVIKTIPDIVYAKDLDHKFVLGNQSFAERYGLDSPDEIIGKTDFDLYSEAEAKAFHAAEDVIFTTKQPQINRLDSTMDSEGNERWKLKSKYVIRNSQDTVIGLLGYSQDITEIKAAERELEMYRDNLEELVTERTNELEKTRASLARAQEIAHLGNWDWDIIENTLSGSDEAYNIYGIKYGLINKGSETFMRLVHPEDQTTVQKAIDESISTKTPYRIDHRVIRPDGSQRTVQQQGEVLLDEHGKVAHMVGTVLDITEQHQIEQELKSAKEAAEAANLHLMELDNLKSMFIASMSHELRTPLNSIIGFTGMMLQGISGEINERQTDNLQRVYQSGKHLLSLISDIIDISKIEAGRIDVFPQNISLGDLINEAVTTIQPEAAKKGLTVTIASSTWPEIESDRKRLLQCVLNLLSNAVKYSEQGKIQVNITELEHLVEISVCDTGIGISESDLPILFEAFERLESHLRIISGGTGLGLYLTKKIIQELLNGDVSVRSTLGEGSTFTLSVPRKYSGLRSVNDE